MRQIYTRLGEKLRPLGYVDLVFGAGDEKSEVVLIGEAPGRDEVAAKKTVCGESRKNLDEFFGDDGNKTGNTLHHECGQISAIQNKRQRYAEQTGPPTAEEIALCSSCLREELAAIAPRLIVTLGNTALEAVAGGSRIGDVHGTLIKSRDGEDVFALYHPASVIYRPGLKEVYRNDLTKLKQELQRLGIA